MVSEIIIVNHTLILFLEMVDLVRSAVKAQRGMIS